MKKILKIRYKKIDEDFYSEIKHSEKILLIRGIPAGDFSDMVNSFIKNSIELDNIEILLNRKGNNSGVYKHFDQSNIIYYSGSIGLITNIFSPVRKTGYDCTILPVKNFYIEQNLNLFLSLLSIRSGKYIVIAGSDKYEVYCFRELLVFVIFWEMVLLFKRVYLFFLMIYSYIYKKLFMRKV